MLAFVVAVSILTWRNEHRRQAAYLDALASMGERSFDTFFRQLEAALGLLGEEVQKNGEHERAHAALDRLTGFRERFPLLSAVNVVRADGRIVASTSMMRGAAPPSLKGEADFVASMAEFAAGRQFSISRPLYGRVTPEWLISLRHVVRDAAGAPLFFIAGALPLARAQGFWAESPVPDGVVLGILRDDGYLLVRHPNPPGLSVEALYREQRTGALVEYLRQAGFPESGVIDGMSSSLREQSIIAFRRFEHYPMTFRVSAPTANVWDAWWVAVLPIYGLTLVLAAGLVGIGLWSNRMHAAWDAERERQIGALEAANAELMRANHELDSFSYTVAHDLRAPVRALDGFAGLLESEHGGALGPEGRMLLARVRAASARMDALIDGLLTFARLARDDLRRQPVDTAALVAVVVAEAVPAGSPCRVSAGPLPQSSADPLMLRAVWSNLIANAVKYSRGQAEPHVEVGHADGAFFVRDNGVGFDMAYGHNLFGVFQRLHSPTEFEGTGVGLAIVRRIVERHGGRVWATSGVGEGAEFRFTLGTAT